MAEDKEPTGGQSVFWLVYGQIAAMLGAFSLLVLLTNFFDLGLRGMLGTAVEAWVTNVRPTIGSIADWTANLLPSDWRFGLDEWGKDYFAVGFVAVGSFLRVLSMQQQPAGIGETALAVVWAVSLFFCWPLYALLTMLIVPANLLARATGTANELDADIGSLLPHIVLWGAPLIYLGLVFAANAWLV